MPSGFTGRTTAFGSRRGGGWLWAVVVVLLAGVGVAGYYARPHIAKSSSEDENKQTTQQPKITGPILGDKATTTEEDLEGVALFKAGKIDESIRWFNDYLAGGVKAPRADAALFYIGMAWYKKGDTGQMSGAWKRLGDEFPRSEYTAKMLAETAKLTPDKTERTRTLYLLWKGFSGTEEGKQAALAWADEAYELYAGTAPDYTKWEDLWEAYSIALAGMPAGKRDEAIKKTERIAGYFVLNPAAMPRGAVKVRTNPGDSLSALADRSNIPVEMFMRVNGLKSDVIQPGQEFKVYPMRTKLVVDRARFTLDLHINDKFFKEYNVGVGKGDLTPAGTFSIKNRVRMPVWFKNNERIPYGDPRNILGTRWMGFGRSGPGKSLGIHGTTEPQSVPGKVSQGCIRMLNEDAEEVYDLTTEGTEVQIL